MLKIQNDTIVDILSKKTQEEFITTDEQKILDEWRSSSTMNQDLFDEVMDKERWNHDLKLLLSRNEKATWNTILSKIEEGEDVAKVVKIRKPWYKYAAAAAVIGVLLLAGTYFLNSGSDKNIPSTVKVAQEKSEVREDDRASLKLSDGSTIYVDQAANGKLAQEGNSKIYKSKDGEIVYDAASLTTFNQLPLTVNILSTPRGAQQKLILSDGSKVWLNAASTLRFPSSFAGKERVVELDGEAYFEISSLKSKVSAGQTARNTVPFFVKAKGVTVEVLGTHFNVMAYQDEEEIKTSLIEGSVKVINGANARLLKPGQQAKVSNTYLPSINAYEGIRVENEGTEEATAWKDGYLNFKRTDVSSVLRQLSRSYRVDVVYKGSPSGTFTAVISRKTNISEVVSALASSGVAVKFENNKIIVLPAK